MARARCRPDASTRHIACSPPSTSTTGMKSAYRAAHCGLPMIDSSRQPTPSSSHTCATTVRASSHRWQPGLPIKTTRAESAAEVTSRSLSHMATPENAARSGASLSLDADVLAAYRAAGRASAAAAAVEAPGDHRARAHDRQAAAFFDVDNTLMRGASLFHFAAGLARKRFFTAGQITRFARAQAKFVLSGSEDLEDMASATESALSFVNGRTVSELIDLGQEIFTDSLIDKLIPGTLALTQGHLDSGQRVWLVTATPVELATIISSHLGLTGALGTVAEVVDGTYTGRLVAAPLHGMAKAEAVRALAEREGLDLAQCSAYSDSANDIPMLSIVGRPIAVNPDPTLRAHARDNDWPIRDFRRRAQMRRAVPAVTAGAGVVAGLATGYAIGRIARR